MFTERRRAVTLCCVAIVINLVCSEIARCFNLPLWLDTTGTVYAAMILGFPYGFVVGLVNNAFWTIVSHGYNSFAFYVVSMAVAFIAAKVSPRPAKMSARVFLELTGLLFFVSALLASITTFLVDAGIPSDYWGQQIMNLLEDRGMDSWLASVIAVAGIKLLDTVITLALVAVALKITPVKYLDESFALRRSST